jgi:hypothetical protein
LEAVVGSGTNRVDQSTTATDRWDVVARVANEGVTTTTLALLELSGVCQRAAL